MIERVEQEQLLALLAWWRAAGVDAALADDPIDWTARPGEGPGLGFEWPTRPADFGLSPAAGAASPTPGIARPSPGQPAPSGIGALRPPAPSRPSERPSSAVVAQRPAPVPASRPPGAASPDAASLAAGSTAHASAPHSASTLEALHRAIAAFDGCGLKATAKSLCFYRGAASARLMLIGEAPGREEDLEGRPFVGPSGQLLDRMLAAIGLAEDDVHLTNTVYWRPPGNRPPTPQETLACRPFLERQIALVRPAIIVTLGGPAVKAVLGVEEGILRVRGKWRELHVAGHSIRVLPTLHPAYLLRTPAAKRQAWRDLLAVKAALHSNPGTANP